MTTSRQLSPQDWESLRARFSHDWLRNRLAISLGKYQNVLLGNVVDDSVVHHLAMLADQWTEQRPEIEHLVDEAIAILSPKRAFETAAFSAIDPETLAAAGDAAEHDWLERAVPLDVMRRSREALRRLDAVMRDFRAIGPSTGQDALAWVADARLATHEVAEALTALGQCRNR